MECLFLPRDPTEPLPKVKLYASSQVERFNGANWVYFPNEMGMADVPPTTEDLSTVRSYIKALLCQGSTTARHTFTQAWLFFGLISEVLGGNELDKPDHSLPKKPRDNSIVDQVYTTMTVVKDDALYVDTSRLLTYMESAYATRSQDRVQRTKRCTQLQKCLQWSLLAFSMMDEDLFDQALRYSIGAVGEVISHATFVELQQLGLPTSVALHWSRGYYSQYAVRNRMLRNGWCRSDISRAQDKFQCLQTWFFLSYLDRSKPHRNHDQCTEVDCAAYQIDIADYNVKHANDCIGCGSCRVDTARVTDILHGGSGFPVLEVIADGSDVKVTVCEHSNETPFVALSHVWADGLGNPLENCLHECQMRRIQEIIKNIERTRGSDTSFVWIDTLCCPVRDAQAKKLAINRIRDVYTVAEYVLVLDASLTSYASKNVDLVELMARIFNAEGALAQEIYFLFRDGAISLDDIRQRYNASLGSIRDRLMMTDIFQEMQGLYAFFREGTHEKSAKLGNTAVKAYLPTEPRVEYTIDANVVQADIGILDKSLLYRSVSVAADEPLCIATLMGLPLKHIQEASPEERMSLLWLCLSAKLGGIPTSIIFSQDARMTQAGFRWAPKSFLTTNSAAVFDRGTREQRWSGQQRGVITPLGLRVNYTGFVLTRAASDPWPMLPRLAETRLLFRDASSRFWQINDMEHAVRSRNWSDEERRAHHKKRLYPLNDILDMKKTAFVIADSEVPLGQNMQRQMFNAILATAREDAGIPSKHGVAVNTQRHIVMTTISVDETIFLEAIEAVAWCVRLGRVTEDLENSWQDESSTVSDDMIQKLKDEMKNMLNEAIEADVALAAAVDRLWDGEASEHSLWVLVGNWFHMYVTADFTPDGQTWLVD